MLGCDVIVSGNMPTNLGGGTNETCIIAMDARDLYRWENDTAPVHLRAEQRSAASLGVFVCRKFVQRVHCWSATQGGQCCVRHRLILPAL
jgi:hypothetical protein